MVLHAKVLRGILPLTARGPLKSPKFQSGRGLIFCAPEHIVVVVAKPAFRLLVANSLLNSSPSQRRPPNVLGCNPTHPLPQTGRAGLPLAQSTTADLLVWPQNASSVKLLTSRLMIGRLPRLTMAPSTNGYKRKLFTRMRYQSPPAKDV